MPISLIEEIKMKHPWFLRIPRIRLDQPNVVKAAFSFIIYEPQIPTSVQLRQIPSVSCPRFLRKLSSHQGRLTAEVFRSSHLHMQMRAMGKKVTKERLLVE
jgi:hypothetical protein